MPEVKNDNRSFHKILDEKLSELSAEIKSSTDSVINSSPTPIFSYENTVFRLSIPIHTTPKAAHLPSYFKKILKKSDEKTAIPLEKTQTKAEAAFAIDKLSTCAQLGLLALDAEIEPDGRHIKASAIKRAFRKKAREHHPDLNPIESGRKFNEYRELSKLILEELKDQKAS